MKSAASATKANLTKVSAIAFEPTDFLTTQELMKLLKIKHRQTIYGLIEAGMPVLQAGRNYRFPKSEVITFLKRHSRVRNNGLLRGRRK